MVALEIAVVGEPPAVVADPLLVGHRPVELAAGDPLADLDCLEHRAVGEAPATEVVDGGAAARAVELQAGACQVRGVDVVAYLLFAVALVLVLRRRHRSPASC